MSNYTYTKHNWEDKPSSNTPITAEKLNEIEEGIYNANENKVDKEDGKGLSTNDLTDDLITDIAASKKSAHTHSNKETLDGITNLTVDKWNTVTDKVDKVDGKGLSENDFTSALKSDYDKAVQDSHTHNNKSVIDKFSESDGQLLYSGESISGKTEIDDTQSSTETTYSSSKIEELIGEGGGGNPNALTKEVVTELPSYEDAKDNVLYLIEDTTTPVPSEEVIDDENVSSNTTYSSQKITDLLDTKVDNNDFTEHITDTDIHVTADKKTSWDGAVTNSHTHDNKLVLDKFSEDSAGNLLYNGKSIIGGGDTPQELVAFSTATDEELIAMVDAYYNGEITLEDVKSVWSVGDTRTFHLSAMDATYAIETHREQDVQMVILDFEHDDLTNPINGKTKALVTLGQKDCLMDEECEAGTKYGTDNTENGYLSTTEPSSWVTSIRRNWSNISYYNAIPQPLRNIIKRVKKYTISDKTSLDLSTTNDYIFIPSEIEVMGSYTYSTEGEGEQYEFYKTSSNRYKKPLWNSSAVNAIWYFRSLATTIGNQAFCCISYGGNASYRGDTYELGIAPNFCI